MASNFVGLLVAVTLAHPPNTTLIGRVAHVDPQTSTLGLEDVFYPANGSRVQRYTVEGHQIADIKIQQEHNPPPPPTPQHVPYPITPITQSSQQHNQWPQYQQANIGHPIAPPRPSITTRPQQQQSPMVAAPPRSAPALNASQPKKTFVDPAILSMARPPTAGTPEPIPALDQYVNPVQEAPATPIKPIVEAAAAPVAQSNTYLPGAAKKPSISGPAGHKKENVTATLTAPFTGMGIEADGQDGEDSDDLIAMDGSVRRVSLTKTRTGKPMDSPAKPDEDWKRTRRGGKGRKKKTTGSTQNAPVRDAPPESAKKGKGWRQTPLLQEDSPGPRTPGVISGKVGLAAVSAANRKEKKQKALERSQNGWATEDATDIQDMPEFDFANNLAKFDKRSVFDQLRSEDTVAGTDRLVSFNRIQHRPGTHGGKNLHPTENVLDGSKIHQSGSYSSSSESEFGSGRNSRRAMSRASSKRVPQRTGSGVMAENLPLHQTAASILSRNKSNFGGPVYTSSHATGSPKPQMHASPPESPFMSPRPQGNVRPATFRVLSTNRTCHTITPESIITVENSAETDYGMSEDMMAENAGRGIAEVTLATINPGGRRLARDNLALNAKPVIVVLIGNHRSGARAVAAARQLYARGVRVMVTILGYNRDPEDRDPDLRRQVELFQRYGGTVRSWAEVEIALKKLEAPPELIIDALLGRHRQFDKLEEVDQKEAMQIIAWANKSHAGVLAVEAPSGVCAETGNIAIIEGEPLEVRAKHIVCLGAPRIGLLRALDAGVSGADWMIWVVDIGLNHPWKRSGVPGPKGVPFGGDWVIKVGFSPEIVDGR